jgi:hypothetical protein
MKRPVAIIGSALVVAVVLGSARRNHGDLRSGRDPTDWRRRSRRSAERPRWCARR